MSRDPAADALAHLARLEPPAASEPDPALLASLGPIRPVATRSPRGALARVAALSVGYAVLLVVGLGVRRDMHELPRWFVAGFALVWTSTFGLALVAGLVPRRGQVVPDVGRLRVALVPGVLALCALGYALAQHGPSSVISTESLELFVRRALPCIAIAMVVSLVPVWIGARALRHAVPAGAPWIAGALGAAGGALGAFVLHMHCPVADGAHMGLVHGGSMALAALLASWRVARTMEP